MENDNIVFGMLKDLQEGDSVLEQCDDNELKRLSQLDANDPEDWEEMMEYL